MNERIQTRGGTRQCCDMENMKESILRRREVGIDIYTLLCMK